MRFEVYLLEDGTRFIIQTTEMYSSPYYVEGFTIAETEIEYLLVRGNSIWTTSEDLNTHELSPSKKIYVDYVQTFVAELLKKGGRCEKRIRADFGKNSSTATLSSFQLDELSKTEIITILNQKNLFPIQEGNTIVYFTDENGLALVVTFWFNDDDELLWFDALVENPYY